MADDNPLDRYLTITLAEFNGLRAEIVYRSTAQYTLLGITLVAAGAIAGLAIGRESVSPLVSLLLGPLCVGTGLYWLDHARAIFTIGRYIRDELWKSYGDRLLGNPAAIELPIYEEYVLNNRPIPVVRGVMAFPFMLIFIIPPIVATLAVSIIDTSPIARIGCLINVVLVIVLIAYWIPTAISAFRR